MRQLGALTLKELAIAATGPFGAAYSVLNDSPLPNKYVYAGIPDPKPAPAPSAPKSVQQAQTWNPEQQIQTDSANYAAWRKTAMDDFPLGSPDDSLLILAAGVAVLALYLSFKR